METDLKQLYRIYKEHPVVTTDSRDCPVGSIFFALKGPSFNGNAFAAAALEKGCAYAVVDEEAYAPKGEARILLVDDVLTTLQQLAHYHREQLHLPVIEVTGTNGKTTTKELVSAVLSMKYRVLYTQGNLNNHIGVPRTLLRLTEDDEVAVIETGANHPGEIATLARIVDPDYGIITNVGKAHLEGFGSFEGVVRTKGELYDYLRQKPGTSIFLNNDSADLCRIATGLKAVRYGSPCQKTDMTVEGEVVECAPFLTFRWRQPQGEWHQVNTHLIGSYNVDNMLAAAAIGITLGVSAQQIDEALTAYVPSNNRSQLSHTAHNHLVIDAYNANPTSMMAALKNFRDMKVNHKMLILGEMRELGESSVAEHQKVLDFIPQVGAEQVWLVGDAFCSLPSSFRCFHNVDEVKMAIAEQMPNDCYILIKGSNGTKLFQLPECL